jgi:hypothetical protein
MRRLPPEVARRGRRHGFAHRHLDLRLLGLGFLARQADVAQDVLDNREPEDPDPAAYLVGAVVRVET